MQISVINIGNSKGIRLSKKILDKYNITDKVELTLKKNQIVLKPVDQPRKGWPEAFEKMHENGDDQLLVDDVFEDENVKRELLVD